MYEPHEYCLAFPEMPASDYKLLVDSIRSDGLWHPVALYEGKILDGRHRYRACVEAGIEPTFEPYIGSDPMGFVIRENARRRHLTPSQVAIAATKLAEIESKRARQRQEDLGRTHGVHPPLAPAGAKGEEAGKTAAIVAQKAGVGRNTMQRAINVKNKGAHELIKAVEDGKVTVTEGDRIARLSKDSQRKIVAIEDSSQRAKETGRRLQIAGSKRSALQQRSPASVVDTPAYRGDAYVPGTPYVKRFLSRIEFVVDDLKREFDLSDADAIANRFLREMDWSQEQLKIQAAHCEKLFSACARIHSELQRSRAA